MSLSQPPRKAKKLMPDPDILQLSQELTTDATARSQLVTPNFSSLQALPSHTRCMFYKTQRCENSLK